MKVCILCSEIVDRQPEGEVLLGVCQVCEALNWPANVEPPLEAAASGAFHREA